MASEVVNDVLFLAQVQQSASLPGLIDEHYCTHGNWDGPSLGTMVSIWLTSILSSQKHQLYLAEDWLKEKLESVQKIYKCPELETKHLKNERLALILDILSDDKKWLALETKLNQGLIQVYELTVPDTPIQTVRLDATIAQSFREASGLFAFGPSKQRRSDIPQIKIMVSALDPSSFPLHCDIVAGNCADDPLYLPSIEKLSNTMPIQGLLMVADTKAGFTEFFAKVSDKEAYYLIPLSKLQCSNAQLKTYLDSKPEQTIIVMDELKDGTEVMKAELFELPELTEFVYEEKTYQQRRIVAYSVAYGVTQKKAFMTKKEKCLNELNEILLTSQGKRVPKTEKDTNKVVQGILKKYGMIGFVNIIIHVEKEQKGRRAYKDRPAEVIEIVTIRLEIQENQEAIVAHIRLLGWRVYATTAPKEVFQAVDVVKHYWKEYGIEHKIHELLNKTTSLMPLYLHKQDRIKALVRFLVMGLKFSSVIQHKVGKELEKSGEKLTNVIPNNPKKEVSKPTFAMILYVFRNIILNKVTLPCGTIVRSVDELTPVQKKVLNLMGFPVTIYHDILLSG
jgi:transposase